jgi:pimeloyl-ACP methyl ester carboxylesterase
LARFTASDGASIHYEVSGQGRPLLLLHGLMAHGGFWDAQANLADTHRLIIPDLRGHGLSRADVHSLSITRLTRDMQELADQLDLHDAVVGRLVAGRGGRLAAAGRPVRGALRRLRGRGHDPAHPQRPLIGLLGLSPELIAARTAAFRGDFESFTATAGQAVLAPPLTGEKARLAAWASAEFARNDPAAMAALWDSLAEEDHRPLLPRIAQPSLIVRGAHSIFTGRRRRASSSAASRTPEPSNSAAPAMPPIWRSRSFSTAQ